jgi:hypothetical protein
MLCAGVSIRAQNRRENKETREEIVQLTLDPEQYIKVEPKSDAKGTAGVPKGQIKTGWTTIKYEGFEGAFPNEWSVYTTHGGVDAYWDDTAYKYYAGSWSCFCADLGSASMGYGGQYVNDMYAWLVYGPFDLSDATEAEWTFYHWTKTTLGDWFHNLVSVDGVNFIGGRMSGDFTDEPGNVNGWLQSTRDLSVVGYIYPVGQPQVWVAFVFSSNESDVNDGTYVDEVYIRKNVPEPVFSNLLADADNCSYTFTGGRELTVFARTTNNGAGDSGPSNMAYYLSEDNVIGTDDYRIAEDYQHIIAPGAYEDDSCRVDVLSVDADPDLPDGTHTYYVGFLLDDRNEVAESNEADNAHVFDTPITFTKGVPKMRYIARQIEGGLPVIDGVINEMAWAFAEPAQGLLKGGIPGVWEAPWMEWEDNLVVWVALWSSMWTPGTNTIYLAVVVHDDVAGASDHDFDNLWQDDTIEIYADGDLSGGDYTGDPASAQLWCVRRDNAKHINMAPGPYTGSSMLSNVRHYANGDWVLEAAIEIYDRYDTDRRILSVGDVIGWEIWYNDSDNEQQQGGLYLRDHQVGWAYTGPAWQNADYMQELELGGVSEKTIVRFQVDMRYELPNVNPGEMIGVRGTHYPLSWSYTLPMWDLEGDGTFTVDVDFTGIAPGTVIEYKFVHHAPPEDNSTGVIYEPNPGQNPPYYNREAVLSGATEVLPLVYWNNDATGIEEESDVPSRYELCQNYPNPFNPNTTIRYSIPKPGVVCVTVYNLQGQKVKTIINEFQQAGTYSRDFNTAGLSSGIYYYQLKVDGTVYDMKKMVLAR